MFHRHIPRCVTLTTSPTLTTTSSPSVSPTALPKCEYTNNLTHHVPLGIANDLSNNDTLIVNNYQCRLLNL
eukprot:m.223379 g.223379  ORF g.223379 m.223379 type:complete len:71 (-) comp33401_c0_seq5:745-957(-)